MIKISICGKMNSGKNTVATLLSQHFPNKAPFVPDMNKIVAFADPIKEIVMTMFPWADRDCLYGSSDKRKYVIPNAFDNNGNPLTYRQALNDIGTNGRNYNKNNWINVFDSRLKYFSKPKDMYTTKVVICTDVRFINEFQYLKKEGFFNLKLSRSNISLSNHATETEQDSISLNEFEGHIFNDGTIEDLKINVDLIATKIASLYAAGSISKEDNR